MDENILSMTEEDSIMILFNGFKKFRRFRKNGKFALNGQKTYMKNYGNKVIRIEKNVSHSDYK
jgi:hypothetical protein